MKIVAALRPTAATLSTKKIFEDIVKGLAEAAPAESVLTSTLLGSSVAEHVVAFAFFLIAQGLVGFVDFFELFFRRFLLGLSRLQIGMVLAGHLPIGLFELVVGRSPFDA